MNMMACFFCARNNKKICQSNLKFLDIWPLLLMAICEAANYFIKIIWEKELPGLKEIGHREFFMTVFISFRK